MKIWTTYFYKIRFFKPWMIPLSTADWDPKWFHDFRGQDYIWKDKNDVWNGLRLDILSPSHICSILPPECIKCSEPKDPGSCSFLKDYREGLRKKLNFEELMDYLERTAVSIQKFEGFQEEPEIMLLLHESPGNLCSERIPLQEYFIEHGLDIKEWYT